MYAFLRDLRKTTVIVLVGGLLVNICTIFAFTNLTPSTLYRVFANPCYGLEMEIAETFPVAHTLHMTNSINAFIYSNRFDASDKQTPYILSSTRTEPQIVNPVRPITCDGCFDVQFKYLINNKNICHSHNKSVQILLLITSAPKNLLARETLRATWLTSTNHNNAEVRYVFLLGKSQDIDDIYNENARTKDVVLADFQDVYSNLTFKTIMGFQWAIQFCKTAQFIMKTDDDMYVNIPGLIKTVQESHNSLQTAVGGKCVFSAYPVRDRQSKWYASYNSYPQKCYPGFCSGTGYVTSINVVSKIIEISRNIPFFHLEDVYVSLCIRQLGYRLENFKGFAGRPSLDPCLYKNKNFVTAHEVPVTWMKQIWNTQCSSDASFWRFWE